MEKALEGGGRFALAASEEEACAVGETNLVWDLRVERMNLEVLACTVAIVGRGVGVSTDIETELQGARRYYNATVRDLDSTIQSFPPVLIARPMGFTEERFYQDDDPAIQSAPKVSFDRPAA